MTDGAGVAPSVRLMLDEDRTRELLGIDVEFAQEGQARATMLVRSDMVNGHAIVHGGLVFSLADTTFACAVNSYGPSVVTASADVTYLRPGRLGDVLVAEAVTRARHSRTLLCDVTVRRGEEIIAEFRGRGARLKNGSGESSQGRLRPEGTERPHVPEGVSGN